MRLIELQLENVFQYEQATIPFGPGVNGLTGPNGCGKSNILKAIYGALTNDWTTNHGPKLANVSQYAAPDAVSRVLLTAIHGELTFTVCRGFAKSGSWLELSDGRRIEGDDKINRELMEILGLSLNSLKEFVFVMQGELFTSCKETRNAARKDRMAQLFGLQWAETCHKAINDFVLTLVIPEPAVTSAELQLQLQDSRRSRSDVQYSLGKLPDYTGYDPNKDRQFAALFLFNRRKALKQAITKAGRTLRDKRRHLEQLLSQCRPVRDELTRVETWLAENRERGARLVADKAAWTHYNQLQQAATAAQQSRIPLEQQLQQLTLREPVCPAQVRDTQLSTLDTRIGELRQSIQSDKSYLTNTAALAHGICPQCRRPGDETCEHLREETQTAVTRAEGQLATYQLAKQMLQAYQQQHTAWQNQQRQLQQRLAGIHVPAVPEAVAWSLGHQDELDDYNKAEAKYQQLRANPILRSIPLCDRLQGEYDTLYRQQFQRLQQFRRLHGSREAYRLAVRAWQQTQTNISRWQQLRDDWQQLTQEMDQLQQQCTAALQQEQRAATLKEYRARFLKAREYLHRDALPQQVAARNMTAITDEMNMLLERRSADYVVTLDADLTLIVNFHDGRVQPAPRLSGGQLVSLATTFWLAANGMLAQLGLLCLDEPTEYLDAESRAALPSMLERLREMATTDGLQCLIATHDQSLEAFFEHRIAFQGIGLPVVAL